MTSMSFFYLEVFAKQKLHYSLETPPSMAAKEGSNYGKNI
jgi:hypothetical protein